jgi:hypothetical protein
MEDKVLKMAVKQHKSKGWNYIANWVNNSLPKNMHLKNSNQCRERWSNQLNPEVQLGALNKEEVKQVFSLHKELGNRWSTIASKLPGRTDNVVKNWFLCKLRKLARCIKKESTTTELPEDSNELWQVMYMLDYLYKYYISLERYENITKSLNPQIKKRKNEGDKYINRMIDTGAINTRKLSVFVKLLLSEVRFSFDKSVIKDYEYLLNLDVNQLDSESSCSQVAVSGDLKNDTVVSTQRKAFIKYRWKYRR